MECSVNSTYIDLTREIVEAKKNENINNVLSFIHGGLLHLFYQIDNRVNANRVALELTAMAVQFYKEKSPLAPLVPEEFDNINYLRNFLGVKMVDLTHRPEPLASKSIDNTQEILLNKFDQSILSRKAFNVKKPTDASRVFPELHFEAENRMLLRVTSILDFKPPSFYEPVPVFSEPLAYGNMIDYVAKDIVRNITLPYSELRERLRNDDSLRQMFASYSYKNLKKEFDENDKTLQSYFDDFLDDAMYLSKELDKISDARLIVLPEAFKIYSINNSIIGEIDMIAIHKDGSFTVLDIKTGSEETDLKDKRYFEQVALYTHMIEETSGLRPSGKVGFVLVKKSVKIAETEAKKAASQRLFTRISEVKYKTAPLSSFKYEDLLNKADKYRNTYYKDSTLVQVKGKATFRPRMVPVNPFLKEFKKRGLASLFKPTEEISTRESLNQEIEWILRVFPELKTLKNAGKGDHVLRIVNTLLSDRGGEFLEDSITLALRSNKGVGYHEGWHRFSQLYLTKEEKFKLYDEVRKLNIRFRTRDNRTLRSKDASLVDIEELLAEEFSKYALDPGNYQGFKKSADIKPFFQELWEILKSFLGWHQKHGDNSVMQFFSNLKEGNFYRSNYSVNNSIFNNLASRYINTKTGEEILSKEDFVIFVDYSDNKIGQYLSEKSSVLPEYLNKEGLKILKKVIYDEFVALRDLINNDIESMEDGDEFLSSEKSVLINLERILESEVTFNSFFRAYLKESSYQSFKNANNIKTTEIDEVLGESAIEFDLVEAEERFDEMQSGEINSGAGTNFNSDSNRNVLDLSVEVLDFFNGIPKLSINDKLIDNIHYSSFQEYDNNRLPLYLDKKLAFSKFKSLASGKNDWVQLLAIFDDPLNYTKFPELIVIKERLLGYIPSEIEQKNLGLKPIVGIYNKFIQSLDIETDVSKRDVLFSFLNSFKSIMSMSRHEELQLGLNLSKGLDGKKVSIINMFASPDRVEYDIITSFKYGISNKSNPSSYDAIIGMQLYLVSIGAINIKGIDKNKAESNLLNYKYFKHPISNNILINPVYLKYLLTSKVPENSDDMMAIKELFDYVGINLNDNVYKYFSNEVISSFKVIHSNMKGLLSTIETNADIRFSKRENVQALRDYTTLASSSKTDTITRVNLEANAQNAMNLMYKILTDKPVAMVVDEDNDLKTMQMEFAFSRTIPALLSLASLEKNFKDKFSTGSVSTNANETQYVYHLPSYANTVISKLASVTDASQLTSTDIKHLNPITNPKLRNSLIIQALFKNDGSLQDPSLKLSFDRLHSFTYQNEEGDTQTMKLSEMNESQKITYDLITMLRYGVSEIRRAEASNSFWTLYLKKGSNPIRLLKDRVGTDLNPSFDNNAFITAVQGYIQYAMTEFHNELKDPRLAANKQKLLDSKAGVSKYNLRLGIFDDMLSSKTIKKLKDSAEKNQDNNDFFDKEFDLGLQVRKEVADYFEGIAIKNKDSYLNEIKNKLADTELSLLKRLALYDSTKVFGKPVLTIKDSSIDLFENPDFKNNIRDYIALDFIMIMEETMLLFSDYSNYKDPIKRRKILVNSGTTIVHDNFTDLYLKSAVKQSHANIYHQGKTPDRNWSLIRRGTIEDVKRDSNFFTKNLPIDEFVELYKTYFPAKVKGKTDEQIKDIILKEKAITRKTMSDIEIADGAAYISIDTYRLMRIADKTWDFIKDEMEYKRQGIIFKKKLYEEGLIEEGLTEDEMQFLEENPKPITGFNVAKMAATGPVANSTSFKNIFDKMGLKVLLPDTDWDGPKRGIYEYMLQNNIDYFVYDTGTKAWKSQPLKLIDENNNPIPITLPHDVLEISRSYFKLQLNTSTLKDKSVFATQLRGLFFEIKNLHKMDMTDPVLEKAYDDYITEMKDFMKINSKKALDHLGFDQNGNLLPDGKKKFVAYMKDKLSEFDEVDTDLIDLLNIDLNGDFITMLESLAINPDMKDIFSGVIDSVFRRIELPGSKLYMSPEVLSTNLSDKDATIGLKWAGFIKNKKGKIVGVSPVEVKISMTKKHESLFNLIHEDGNYIGKDDYYESLARLNYMLGIKEFVEANRDALTFIGLRIPMQDMNFSTEMVVREFLPESNGDIIIAPPEFYKQIGGDNDIDTITATYKTLNSKGKVIKKPKMNYEDIMNSIDYTFNRIKEINVILQAAEDGQSDSQSEEKRKPLEEVFRKKYHELLDKYNDTLLEKYLELGNTENTYYDELDMITTPGEFYIQDTQILKNLWKNDPEVEFFVDEVSKLHDEFESEVLKFRISQPKLDTLIEEKEDLLIRKRKLIAEKREYIPGTINNVIKNISIFLHHPSNMLYLSETDSMDEIEEMTKEVILLRNEVVNKGESEEELLGNIKLNQSLSPLDASSRKNEMNSFSQNYKRQMLGVFIKFRKFLSVITEMDATMPLKYNSGSLTKLKNKNGTPLKIISILESSLLKDVNDEFKISLYDSKGERITKKISLLASTLLDLFKNPDTFPKLGISWNNYKQFLYLLSEGVPMRDALIFINNPFNRYINELIEKHGVDNNNNILRNYLTKHAIVDSFAGENKIEHTVIDNVFINILDVEIYDNELKPNGKLKRPFADINTALGRSRKIISISDLKKFTSDFYKSGKSLPEYIDSLNENDKKFAKLLHLYTAMTYDYGDAMYLNVKTLVRDSFKVNDEASKFEIQALETAIEHVGFYTPNFYQRMKTTGPLSYLYNDDVVSNLSKILYGRIYGSNKAHIMDTLKNKVFSIYTKNIQRKNSLFDLFTADMIQFIFKNFYFIKDDVNKTFSTPDRFFFKDKNVSVPKTVDLSIKTNDKGVIDFNTRFLENPITLNYIDDTGSFTTFHKFLMKELPELKMLDFFSKLEDVIVPAVKETYEKNINGDELDENSEPIIYEDPSFTETDPKPLNKWELQRKLAIQKAKPYTFINRNIQKFLMFKLNSDPLTRSSEEETIRSQWNKLLNFDIDKFMQVKDKVIQEGKLDLYKSEGVKMLISSYAKRLILFALSQNSPTERDGITKLAPVKEVDKILREAFDNFDRISSVDPSFVDNMNFMFKMFNASISEIGNSNTEIEEFGLKKNKSKPGKTYEIISSNLGVLKDPKSQFLTLLFKQGYKYTENDMNSTNKKISDTLKSCRDGSM
jgi:hypothetical protein